ncbi:hypothetical protein EDD86DRAFT_261593 [Gorgonomyces haynaldii]|nr:hypothetical protein EDD86DRAFT_261593 [Gorgonomyces haynaldii]
MNLPFELLRHIGSFLNVKDYCRWSMTCKRIRCCFLPLPCPLTEQDLVQAMRDNDTLGLYMLQVRPFPFPLLDWNAMVVCAIRFQRPQTLKVLLRDCRYLTQDYVPFVTAEMFQVLLDFGSVPEPHYKRVLEQSVYRDDLVLYQLVAPHTLQYLNDELLLLGFHRGHLTMAKHLLLDNRVHLHEPVAVGRAFFQSDNLELVQLLLEQTPFHDEFLQMSIEYDQPLILRVVMRQYTLSYRDLSDGLVLDALQQPHVALDLLADQQFRDTYDTRLLAQTATSHKRYRVFEHLIRYGQLDPSENDDDLLMQAVDNNDARLVEILLKDTRVNPLSRNGEAIRSCCRKGYLGLVRKMLLLPRMGCDHKLLSLYGKQMVVGVGRWLDGMH